MGGWVGGTFTCNLGAGVGHTDELAQRIFTQDKGIAFLVDVVAVHVDLLRGRVGGWVGGWVGVKR